jgi:hypothetical protein
MNGNRGSVSSDTTDGPGVFESTMLGKKDRKPVFAENDYA